MFVTVLAVFMVILNIWAFTNILLWGMKSKTAKGKMKYYWQMNGLWNIVNLSIVFISLLLAFINADTFNTNQGTQELLIWIVAINILLDLGYVAAGLVIESRGKSKDLDQYLGYGMSIQLQGAFLFFFDTIFSLALLITII